MGTDAGRARERSPAGVEATWPALDSRALESRALDSRALDSRAADSRALDSRALEWRALESRALDSRALDSRALDSRAVDSRALDSRAAGRRVAGRRGAGGGGGAGRANGRGCAGPRRRCVLARQRRLGPVGGADARAGVREEGRCAQRDEDPPFDPGRGGRGSGSRRALLVEDPPDDQQARPQPGRKDHAAVAAGQVERTSLGALEQQREHAGGDEQDRGLDERTLPSR